MQQIFKSLTLSLAAMGNVSMVVLLFFLIFGILGVQVGWGKQRSSQPVFMTATLPVDFKLCSVHCAQRAVSQRTSPRLCLSHVPCGDFCPVQLFHGKFWSCNDASVPDQTACVGTYMENSVVSGCALAESNAPFEHVYKH